jgi:hypothetical protein
LLTLSSQFAIGGAVRRCIPSVPTLKTVHCAKPCLFDRENANCCLLVSEAIALEIVDFNGGNYTGAILFTGFMYIGAAVCLWLVRTWKIGDLERKAAASAQIPSRGQHHVPGNVKMTPFVNRLFVWQRV